MANRSGSQVVRRKCDACAKSEESEPEVTPIVARGIEGGGQALDPQTRNFMESRFGRSFDQVRVHAGRPAAESARSLDARAFTVGPNIVFGEGQYNAGNDAGRHLIAHELVHTIQQGAVGPSGVARSPSQRSEVVGKTVQRVQRATFYDCSTFNNKTCLGVACIPAAGGTGFCRWSGTIAKGCICIPIESTIVDLVKYVVLPALILLGVAIALEALAALVACFMSGACEIGILIAALGFAAAMLVVKLVGGGSGGSGASAAAAPGPMADDAVPGPDTQAPAAAQNGGGAPA